MLKNMSFFALSAIGASAPIAIGVSASTDAANTFLNASKRKRENEETTSEYRTLCHDLALRKHALRNMLFRVREIAQIGLKSTNPVEIDQTLNQIDFILGDAQDTGDGIRSIIESLGESNMVEARVAVTLGIPKAIVRGRIIPDEHAYELQALGRALDEIRMCVESVSNHLDRVAELFCR
jgi:hypothetical protein